LPLWYRHDNRDAPEDSQRKLLEGALLTILELRPAIENGFIQLRERNFHICKKHLQERVPEYSNALLIADGIAPRLVAQFRFTASLKTGKIHIGIVGPEEFLEHGYNGITFHERPSWADEVLGTLPDGKSKPLSPEMILKHGLMELVFRKATSDVALHQFYSTKFHLKYLTNLPGEAFFLKHSLGKDSASVESAAFAELSHHLPLLKELSLEEIVKLRKTEYDSFLLYRMALQKAARERFGRSTHITAIQANELFADVLLPDLLKLRAKVKARVRGNRTRSFLKGTVATGVVVTLGMFTGLLPAKLLEWGATVAGVNLSREIVESLFNSGEVDPECRSDDMYFLLKASEHLED
jgi:hypothetical protein